MHHRPNARHHVLAALLLTVSLGATLSACGGADDFPTNRINQVAAGANNRDGDVKLLGILVLSTAPGEGRVIGSIDNDLTDDSASLTGITSTDDDSFTADFSPVKIDADSTVDLTDQGGLPVTGDFKAGDIVSLEFSFDNGEKHELEVSVVKNCYQYTAVPSPSQSSSESSTAGSASSGSASSGSESESPTAASDSTSAPTSESASPSEGSAGDLYKCSNEESGPSSASEGE
jgi:hypothetical protein